MSPGGTAINVLHAGTLATSDEIQFTRCGSGVNAVCPRRGTLDPVQYTIVNDALATIEFVHPSRAYRQRCGSAFPFRAFTAGAAARGLVVVGNTLVLDARHLHEDTIVIAVEAQSSLCTLQALANPVRQLLANVSSGRRADVR